MDTLKAIWSWILGLFGFAPESTPKVDNPAPRRTVTMDDVEPEAGTVAPKTGTYDPPAGEETINERAQFMYDDMSYFEHHPQELKVLIGTKNRPTPERKGVIAFLETEADYAEMARHYSDSALDHVREWGTEFALTDEIAEAITSAVQTEWGIRNPGRSTGMGMGQDGGQK